MDLADQLSQLTVFSGIPPQELTWLASHGTLRKLCAGETFAAQGVPVETMWVVLSGLTILSQFCPPAFQSEHQLQAPGTVPGIATKIAPLSPAH